MKIKNFSLTGWQLDWHFIEVIFGLSVYVNAVSGVSFVTLMKKKIRLCKVFKILFLAFSLDPLPRQGPGSAGNQRL